jgi:hypothetical protein
MQVIPLSAVASQTLSIALSGQAVQINLYQLGAGGAAAMYMDLISNGVQILTCRKCKSYGNIPNTRAPFMLVGRHYLGFQGDFMFLDTQASSSNPTSPPEFAGFGVNGRWQLIYLSVSDLQAAGVPNA